MYGFFCLLAYPCYILSQDVHIVNTYFKKKFKFFILRPVGHFLSAVMPRAFFMYIY